MPPAGLLVGPLRASPASASASIVLFIIVRLRRHRRGAAGVSRSARASARSCARRSTTARVARGLGIDVDRLFAVTFAVGCGLAGLGGALAADVVGGVDPTFPLKFMVSFLIVVAVGGTRGHLGRAVRRAAARRARRRRQILRSLDRRLHHLRGDGATLLIRAAGPVRARAGDERAGQLAHRARI